MQLERIFITALRNFKQLEYLPAPGINLITGPNGCGKTALLEAIYLLSVARSFRVTTHMPLIHYDEQAAIVHGRFADGQRIGVKKTKNETVIKIDGARCLSTAQLAKLIPMQLVYQDVFQIMDAGPGVRRGFLDWGLFHLKSEYFSIWKAYKKTLKQRNVALKQSVSTHMLDVWDRQLCQLASQLDNYRSSYIELLLPKFTQILAKLSTLTLNLRYQRGWPDGDLITQLRREHAVDLQRGFTGVGPHKANLSFKLTRHFAKDTLSRGQQKLCLYALKIAQAQLLDCPCIYLFDDLAAELDVPTRQALGELLLGLKSQVFITTLEPNALPVLNESSQLLDLSLTA